MVLALRCNKRCDDDRLKSHCMLWLFVFVEGRVVGIIRMVVVKSVYACKPLVNVPGGSG